jgi:hypothetical protein
MRITSSTVRKSERSGANSSSLGDASKNDVEEAARATR